MKKEEKTNMTTGTENTGSQNTGSQNTGSQNTGSQNTGSQNTGSENKGSEKASQLAQIREGVFSITSLVTDIVATGIEQITDKEGNELKVMKEYKFATPLGKRETLKTFDSEIIASTEKIGAAVAGQRILTFVVCKELSRLNNKETLAKMGFNTISEYGKALFGFQKATCNMYAKVGKIFIGDDYKLKSKVLPSSLTVGHLIELTSYVGEDGSISAIEKAYIDGDLTDGLSTAKLRQALKETFKSIESTATDSAETAETTGTAETAETTGTAETAETTGTAETAETTGTADTPSDRLRKDTAKVFSATIFLRDFVASHFSDDVEFSEGVNKVLAVLEDAAKSLLTGNNTAE